MKKKSLKNIGKKQTFNNESNQKNMGMLKERALIQKTTL